MPKSNRRETGRRIIAAAFVLLAAACVSAQTEPAPAREGSAATPAKQTIAPPVAGEVRALWVVRTTLTSPEKIRAMVKSASRSGFNTLVVQVRGRGDAYYTSRWEPRASALKDQRRDFDPLALAISEAKRAGLRVHAWINTSLLANLDDLPTEDSHVWNSHPDWLAVPRAVAAELYATAPADPRYRAKIVEWSKANRAELEGVYTSPAHPAVREHVYSVWMDLLERYPDLSGLHFDYVRLASPDFDHSRTSLDRFRAWLDPRLSTAERRLLDDALKSNPLAAADAYREQFADFQREQITSLVERVYHGVKKRKPEAIVSAAVFANDADAYARRFQDWKRWLAMGVIDVVCPMAYTTDTAVFRKQIEIATAAAHASGKRIWAGVGAYRIPVESSVEKISVARGLAADGFILFSYDFTAAPSQPNNPAGDYLERLRRAAFDADAKTGTASGGKQ
ncbi:MAG: family 10 glycosylhydrolase [Acidobacteria bacterium]|nr:family 10 glycosylhydrolase [Acidobacteriota bacterium]MCA1640626.1 family 10 glycosylhydrolase [Acidobacteriota bacterium]